MSAYLIASYDIEDPETYESYVPAVVPLLEKHGAEILVADYDAKPIEGDGRGVNIVLKFDSEAAALNWYNDPDYQQVKQIRLDSTKNGSLILARHFVAPPA